MQDRRLLGLAVVEFLDVVDRNAVDVVELLCGRAAYKLYLVVYGGDLVEGAR